MRQLFSFLLLFSTLALTAQGEEGKTASQLHNSGLALLQKDAITTAFDNLQALGKISRESTVIGCQLDHQSRVIQ